MRSVVAVKSLTFLVVALKQIADEVLGKEKKPDKQNQKKKWIWQT